MLADVNRGRKGEPIKKEDKNMDKKTTSAKALIENVILCSLELNPMELNFS